MATWRERYRYYTRHGVRAGLLLAAKRVIAPLAWVGSIIVFELPVPAGEPSDKVREAGMADVAALARAFGYAEDDLRARFARGDRAFIAVPDGEPLHIRWVTTRPTAIPECSLWLCVGPRQVYLYDAMTVPAVRGQKLAALVRGQMDAVLSAEGYTGKLAYVRADNHSMWNSIRTAPGPLRRLWRVGYIWPHGRRGIALGRYGPPLYATPPPSSG